MINWLRNSWKTIAAVIIILILALTMPPLVVKLVNNMFSTAVSGLNLGASSVLIFCGFLLLFFVLRALPAKKDDEPTIPEAESTASARGTTSIILASAAVLLILSGTMMAAGFFSWLVEWLTNHVYLWMIASLAVAAMGIWGSKYVEGRTRYFLSSVSGLIILYCMFMFYRDHPVGDMGFVERIFFPDDTAKSIALVSLAIFLFATWKRTKTFYAISFLVFLSFLGNATVNHIFDRYPAQLKPSAYLSPTSGGGLPEAVGLRWDNFVDGIKLGGEKEKKQLEEERKKLSDPNYQPPASGGSSVGGGGSSITLAFDKKSPGFKALNLKRGKYRIDPPAKVSRKESGWEWVSGVSRVSVGEAEERIEFWREFGDITITPE